MHIPRSALEAGVSLRPVSCQSHTMQVHMIGRLPEQLDLLHCIHDNMHGSNVLSNLIELK
jgi:hypothetical protein